MARRDDDEQTRLWNPKTDLGRRVLAEEVTDISEVLRSQERILEPEIIDYLVPDLKDEVILIGGTPGKGGGMRRIVSRRTARMHKSGRRFKTKSMVVVGNGNGLLGVSEGYAKDTRDAIDKARNNAKLNMIEIRRGNGSWEDDSTEPTSIPFTVEGKSGSVEVELQPAPRGTGIAASEEVEKLLNLAGIQDIWMKSRGKTKTRENHLKAVYNALKKLNDMNIDDTTADELGVVKGKV